MALFCLPVRLLEARAGTTTTELLGLAAAGVGHKERTIKLHQGLLDLPLRGFIYVLLVIGNDGLGDGLAHSCSQKEEGRRVISSHPELACV